MKKIFAFLMVFMLSLSATFADEYVVSKIECLSVDGFLDQEISFKYDDSENVYYLYRYTYSRSYWFTLTPEEVEKLRANLNKAKDWIKIAKENNSTIKKELPDSKISVEGSMSSGNDWYETRNDIDLDFIFVATLAEEPKITSLLIRGEAEPSRQNQYIDVEFESVVFINEQIDAFIEGISEEAIEAAKEKHKKEKAEADLFN